MQEVLFYSHESKKERMFVLGIDGVPFSLLKSLCEQEFAKICLRLFLTMG